MGSWAANGPKMRRAHVLLLLVFVDYISGNKVTHNTTALESTKDKLTQRNHKLNNQYKNATEHTKIFYTEWSRWSKCKNCKKIRKKHCLSPNCESVLYEEKLCGNKRCRRKNRRNNINIVHFGNQDNERTLSLADKMYTNWSKWQPCSAHCVTRRFRTCRVYSGCPHNVVSQSAFCYEEGSQCEIVVNKIMNDSKYSKRKNKKKVKKRCGYVYHNNKMYISPSATSNMLKIIGGKVSPRSKWPWHVAVLNRHKRVFCGGTLVSPRWVVTAGHCVRNVMYVRLNEFDTAWRDGSEVELKIYEFFRHPNYHKFFVDNDIALLKLPEVVDNSFACLPANHTPAVGENCTTMGWGKRNVQNYRGSNILYEAQLPIVSKDVCLRAYREYKITKNMFCAGYKLGGTDTCAGDSGGGLLCPPRHKQGWTIQGITSFGEGCGKKNKYGIYTKVKNYVSWINAIVNRYTDNDIN